MQWDSIGSWFLLTGAVGTASMGLVETFKVVTVPRWKGKTVSRFGLGLVGLGAVEQSLGPGAQTALEAIYGEASYRAVLEGAWRDGPEELETTLRNGLRMAVFRGDAAAVELVGTFAAGSTELARDISILRSGAASGAAEARERIARIEAAIDARVQAAVATGRDFYVAGMQFTAMLVSIGGCLALALTDGIPEPERPSLAQALIIGVLAVPIAPIAKDVVGFLNAARTAFTRRGAAG